MIPKVIHYCWFGGKPIPEDVQKCMDSWKKYCPDYEIVRWDETNFDVNEHPFTRESYRVKAWAFVSDYARLKIVYDHGGIYLDTDVELLKSPDFLLENECYIGIQQPEYLCNTGLGFGAEKSSPVVRKMLELYNVIKFDPENKSKMACPWLNNTVIISYGKIDRERITFLEGVTVYPPRYFDPISTGKTKNLLCGDTVSIHHYAASWTNGKTRWKRKLVRIIGQKNVLKIKKILREYNE